MVKHVTVCYSVGLLTAELSVPTLNILSIEELAVIRTFVNGVKDREKAKAYCGLFENARMRIKFNRTIKATLNG